MADVRVTKAFYDLAKRVIRKPGDTFSVSSERLDEIESKLPGFVEVIEPKADYSKYTKPQLIDLIEERGLTLPKRQNKADLIAVLEG